MTDPDRLDLLDDATLDHLPYGVIRLGPTGRIERCNRAELERAHLQRWRVLGRDYCRELVGREGPALAAEIAALAPGQRTRVQHTLDRYRGGVRVTIEIARRTDGGAYLCVSPA